MLIESLLDQKMTAQSMLTHRFNAWSCIFKKLSMVTVLKHCQRPVQSWTRDAFLSATSSASLESEKNRRLVEQAFSEIERKKNCYRSRKHILSLNLNNSNIDSSFSSPTPATQLIQYAKRGLASIRSTEISQGRSI